MNTTATSGIPALVQTALDKLDAQRALLMQRIPHIEVAITAADLFKDRFIRIEPYVGDVQAALFITGRSMADVIALRRHLASLGYHVQSVQKYPHEFREVHLLGEIHLYISFPTEGSACWYEKVGTKEVPVYELKCDGKDQP